MEESWTSWLCDMEPDDYSFINQSDTNLDDGNLASHQDRLHEENKQNSLSTESHGSYATMSNSSADESGLERPSKSRKTPSSPCSFILSFDNTNPPPLKVESRSKNGTKVVNHGMALTSKNEPRRVTQETKKKGSGLRSHYPAQDHIIAERMRREKISQQFIALSALIPDLKKMDKASVLGDAIKYVKQLKEQVKVLEEKQSKRKSEELVVFVKKSQVVTTDEDVSDTSSNSCGFGNSDDPSKTNLPLPEVEARVSKKNVLIRIHCEKEKTAVVNIFREIEKLHLSVTSSSAFSFGSSVLDMTIVAEMEDEFNMSVKELARNLRVGLMQFM
ncbi:transcription factor bHLH18-like [Abrus precatorius]|uniref:Transcription factor bHLH18-like n=1 Tax=Abrus precatorius TaxID=3816 RepID=A0A8B8KR83_ABRPR|nr:transcription factor bHLH18-like [Abrus precatorius]